MVLGVLLTILVVRLSEVSTRMVTLENCLRQSVQDIGDVRESVVQCVTHRELCTAMNVRTPDHGH